MNAERPRVWTHRGEAVGRLCSGRRLRFDGDNMVKIDDKLKLARDAAAPTSDSNNVWF